MTVIVGVEAHDGVWMAADSFNGNHSIQQHKRGSKISHQKFVWGEIAFGCCGSPRLIQLIQYYLNVPEPETDDPDKYVAVQLSDALKECFDENGFVKSDEGRDQIGKGSFLVAYMGNIYVAQGYFEVYPIRDGYAAEGAGESVAYGALHALYHTHEEREIVAEKAVKAACHHNPWCAPPIRTQFIPNNE